MPITSSVGVVLIVWILTLFDHFQAAPATTTGTWRGVSTPEEAVIMRAYDFINIYISIADLFMVGIAFILL